MYMDYVLNEDFKEVKDVLIKEELSEEDIEEGLEPEEILIKVGLTKHALERMYDTENRGCDWEQVEELIVSKGNVIFGIRNREEFALVNSKQTLVLICSLSQQKGETVLALHTVIRKVFIDKNYNEKEKKVYLDEKTKKY